MNKNGVFEPIKVKRQAIDSASEAAEIILRIDDIISSRGKSKRRRNAAWRHGRHGRRHGVTCLMAKNIILVAGSPGAGKTTVLKEVAYHSIRP
jgi:Cdc6-like AAA superfamily ATPase